jgi:hypothetical protein
MNATAAYWNTTDYNPLGYPSKDPQDNVFGASLPILPTPWLQMGWGYVGPGQEAAMVAMLEGHPPPPKDPNAVAYMAQVQAAREAYWGLDPLNR